MSEEETVILSKGFKRVEYLQSTGNEVIYTGIIPTDKHGFYAEVESVGGTGYACGTQTGGGLPGFWIYVNNGVLQASYENNSKTTISSNGKTIIKNNFLNDRKLATDISIVKNYSQDFIYDWSYQFTLFKSTYGGNNKFDPVALIRLYRFKISENEEIIRDFIPCLDINDKPCMYDLVSKRPFYNQGTGQFYYLRNYSYSNYILPAGFKKCVYLQSDGTQWIDTGVIPNNETGLYFNALQLTYGNFVPFGVGEIVGNGDFMIYPPRFSGKALYCRWGASAVNMGLTWDKADDLIFHSSLNLYNSKVAKFDSGDTDIESSITSQTGTYTIPIWLFSVNYEGEYNETLGKWIGRIYRAQITQGTDLIHDYVPCLDADNRPCLYDLIGEETLYNQSGGTEFAYCVEHQLPSDFIKLEYLESNSNLQHIKTGYVPTNNTGMYVDAYNTVVADVVVMGMQNTTGNDRMWIGGVMKSSYNARYGWGTITTPGGTGDVRFEASLNWLNDKKSIITCPAFTQRVNTLSDLTFTPNQDIYIFGYNRQGSLSHWKGRIYRAKISEGTEIVRDFVPAYDTRKSKPCMYDLINNVAYYNDGEGEFLHNRDFEGTYTEFSGLGCIGNRLGAVIDGIVPLGYTRIEFLECTSQQAIMTGLCPEKLSMFVKWQITKRMGGHIVSYYAHDEAYTTGQGPNSIGTGVSVYVTTPSDGRMVIDIFDCPIGYMVESEINVDEGYIRLNHKRQSVENLCVGFTKNLPNIDLFRQGYVTQQYFTGRIYTARFWRDGKDLINFIPAIDPNGKPCMFDTVNKKPYYNVHNNMDFIVGLKTISNALQLHLPKKGGTLTLSLPTNDKTEYYEEKIRANNPNWTITFQYH